MTKDEKIFDELKRDLVSFDSERQVIEREHDFISKNKICFSCHKIGYITKQGRENLSSRQDSEENGRKKKCAKSLEILPSVPSEKKFICMDKRK